MEQTPQTLIPNYTPLFLAIMFATFVMAIAERVLILFWPSWIAGGVSSFFGWAAALYFLLRPQCGKRGALWRSLMWATLGGGFIAMARYVFP